MRQLREHSLFLLVMALALPLCSACLYFDFYDDNDLVCHTQISMADNGDLLSVLKKNPKAVVAADDPLQSLNINPLEAKSFDRIDPLSTFQMSSILRC